MFRGINSATLDAKGRMALPARYRDVMIASCAGRMVMTIDMRERCLLLYPLPDWEVVQASLERLSNVQRQARTLQRLLIGHATDIELDANGRFIVPSMLRAFAGLEKKLVLVGQGNKVEVWADQQWQEGMGHWLSKDTLEALDDGDTLKDLSI